MNFKEIIKDNCENHSSVSWWPKFAFHYTDVKNAVNILLAGRLYSRTNAEMLGIMKNDNASRQVIDMTMTEAAANVRFYFRPLTPTQYHNEGYKHPDLRYDQDEHANIPVPVFFVFDLDAVLNTPGVQFSETAQSGHGSPLCQTPEEFSRFNFDKIYSNGYDENWQDNFKFRHAEILCPNQFDIDPSLYAIVCRNDVDRLTLLNLLKNQSLSQYNRYKSKIKKLSHGNMFENNGLFITACQYHDNTLSISFSNTSGKTKHSRSMMKKNDIPSLRPIKGRLELLWLNQGVICYQAATEGQIDYLSCASLAFTNLPNIPGAETIQISFFLENDLMCCIEQSLADTDLIW